MISIHALLAESDLFALLRNLLHYNFYPRSPCGERRQWRRSVKLFRQFLSTLSLRRATDTGLRQDRPKEFLSTLSLRRATSSGNSCTQAQPISIHALLAESDSDQGASNQTAQQISIHALLAESDLDGASPLTSRTISIHALLAESDIKTNNVIIDAILFLSTLSLRRATRSAGPWQAECRDFYPRSPCGERPPNKNDRCPGGQFLSTLSLRRATEYWVGGYGTAYNFYPRSPCGERLVVCGCPRLDFGHFYPRSPCGERPIIFCKLLDRLVISIHALLAESDEYWVGGYGTAYNFYPRSPCGERRLKC